MDSGDAEQEFTDYLRGVLRVAGMRDSTNLSTIRPCAESHHGSVSECAKTRLSPLPPALSKSATVLGDGALTYGPEKIMECCYNFPIPMHTGFFGALDLQYIDNPGYNRDRGPVIVPGMRLHVEL